MSTSLESSLKLCIRLLWTQVVWHPEDNLLAAGSWSGEAHIWDARTGEALFSNSRKVMSKPPSPGTRHWPFAGLRKSVIAVVTQFETYVVDVELNKILQSFDIQSSLLFPLACNRHFKAFAGSHGIIDLESGDFVPIAWHNEINDPHRACFPMINVSSSISEQDAEFSPEGNKLLIIGEGCLLHLHDSNDGRSFASVRAGIYFVQEPYTPFLDSLAWHPDGSRFAAVGQFGGIRIWDAETYELLQRHDGFEAGYGEIREST